MKCLLLAIQALFIVLLVGCSNKNVYIGELKDGKPHGQGISTWENGVQYVGEWKDGKRHGQGRVTWKNGVKYVGEWKDGGKNTDDIITYDFEVIWIGEFRNDQPWNVTSYDKDGNIVGKYVNGEHSPFY